MRVSLSLSLFCELMSPTFEFRGVWKMEHKVGTFLMKEKTIRQKKKERANEWKVISKVERIESRIISTEVSIKNAIKKRLRAPEFQIDYRCISEHFWKRDSFWISELINATIRTRKKKKLN